MGKNGGAKALRAEKSCPLPKTHNRLRQCHDLWHRAQAAYADPDAFCLDLNSLISSLRSVTFVLQAEKHLIPGFSEWYEDDGWQAKMRADPRMRWLVTARNQIEKQGDLETESTARVSLGYDWYDDSHVDLLVPPLLSPQQISQYFFAKFDLPETVREFGYLSVERRWVAYGLSDHELLDALSYCYGVLATIVSEAHARLGTRMYAFAHESHDSQGRRPQSGGPLRCMSAGRDERTATLHLKSGKVIGITTSPAQVAAPSEAEARYGRLAPAYAGEGDFFDFAELVNDYARDLLRRDGFHATVALLYGPEGNLATIQLNFPDRQHKMLTMEGVAREVERRGASAAILISEAWYAPAPDNPREWEGFQASQDPQRVEGLTVVAAAQDGRCRSYSSLLTRTEGGVDLGETDVEASEEHTPGILEPIRRVWRKAAGSH